MRVCRTCIHFVPAPADPPQRGRNFEKICALHFADDTVNRPEGRCGSGMLNSSPCLYKAPKGWTDQPLPTPKLFIKKRKLEI